MNRWNSFRALAALALTSLVVTAAVVPPRGGEALAQAPVGAATEDFPAYLQLLSARARAEGISEATIQRMTAGLTPNQRVIELDNAQPGRSSGPPSMASYLRRHVDPHRIAGGRRVLGDAAGFLPEIERRYGVPAKMIVAIWGHETNYGSYTGDFDLHRSLATLAWEGRRRDLFEAEFIAVLRMVEQGVPTWRLRGSWAGAFGNPQFLPSVYLTTAVDADGDGLRDIWSSKPDTLASIANYFHLAGWRPGEPWGVAAAVPAGFDWSGLGTRLASPACAAVHARHTAWLPVSEWRQRGVSPLGPIGDDTLAALFQPDGPGTRAFLLTGNYRVILQYNCSNYYALSVGLLADEIAR